VRPAIPQGTPAGLVNLMKRCWDGTPSNRPKFDAIADFLQNLESALVARLDAAGGTNSPVSGSPQTTRRSWAFSSPPNSPLGAIAPVVPKPSAPVVVASPPNNSNTPSSAVNPQPQPQPVETPIKNVPSESNTGQGVFSPNSGSSISSPTISPDIAIMASIPPNYGNSSANSAKSFSATVLPDVPTSTAAPVVANSVKSSSATVLPDVQMISSIPPNYGNSAAPAEPNSVKSSSSTISSPTISPDIPIMASIPPNYGNSAAPVEANSVKSSGSSVSSPTILPDVPIMASLPPNFGDSVPSSSSSSSVVSPQPEMNTANIPLDANSVPGANVCANNVVMPSVTPPVGQEGEDVFGIVPEPLDPSKITMIPPTFAE